MRHWGIPESPNSKLKGLSTCYSRKMKIAIGRFSIGSDFIGPYTSKTRKNLLANSGCDLMSMMLAFLLVVAVTQRV